jgi:release factor glutamine methyltransferase
MPSWGPRRSPVRDARAVLEDAVRRLQTAGVDTPRVDAEVMLASALKRSRSWLWAHLDHPVSPAEEGRFTAWVHRRAGREPLAYILEEWEFYGRPFYVSPAVLIPRPETELLVEAVVTWAHATSAQRLVDVGTGSGVIAITLALELPRAQVTAIDISPDALAVARRNAQRHDVEARIDWRVGDLLAPLDDAAPMTLDAVVANLPYIAQDVRETLMPEVGLHEPSLALFAADGGLALIRRLSVQSRAVLRPGGLLALEVGWDQADQVRAGLSAAGWEAVRAIVDYAGIDRHILAHAPASGVDPKEGVRD